MEMHSCHGRHQEFFCGGVMASRFAYKPMCKAIKTIFTDHPIVYRIEEEVA
jgi:hypothetical protein